MTATPARRPDRSAYLSARVPADLVARVDDAARDQDVPRAVIVRRALDEYLTRQAGPVPIPAGFDYPPLS
jgi:predicted transcriptional regulator